MTMYVYYQKNGGDDPWIPIQSHLSLDTIRPTFVTVLATDTLIDATTPNDVKMKAKYQGPMYFDLDADSIEDSIKDARTLVEKLQEYELTAADMLIYLSGKKGLHILIPDVCFMTKPVPMQGLVAMYKELAYKLAVDTMDFRVYTAKRGRQFRTTYNVRENGNYKVPITLSELLELTPEKYNELCKTPRVVDGHSPQWRGRFAILFDGVCQKVQKHKPKPTKPVPPEILKEQLPLYNKLATGQAGTQGGFNVIAMQLALYAREAKWDEDTFIRTCEGIIQNHQSDGSRYNSPRRREFELRRMFAYLEDNPSFEYNAAAIKAYVQPVVQKPAVDPDGYEYSDPEDYSDEEPVKLADFAGVYAGSNVYLAAKGEDGEVAVTNFVFRDIHILRDIDTEAILSLTARICVAGHTQRKVTLYPASFTGGAALQNAVAAYGGSFSGTDVHARGVYQAMLREIKKDSYAVDSEGVNLLLLGSGSSPRKEYVVWADQEGVRCASSLAEAGLSVEFQGYPDPRGNYRTDILASPRLDDILAEQGGEERFRSCLLSAMQAHTPEVMGRLLGWAAACFYAPLFQKVQGKFPLLHVYGPAGNGKTETLQNICRMFYHTADIMQTTPNSSNFAIQTLMSGSGSIPLLIDEYKPHIMEKLKLDMLRAMFRDAYNAKEVQRGGGSKTVKDNYNALTTIKLTAPVAFIAEAPETETALVERSVMVSFKRLSGRAQIHAYRNAMQFYRDTEPLTALGLELATDVVGANDARKSLEPFGKALSWSTDKFLPAPDDYEKVEAGKMTADEARLRSIMRPRTVYNNTVAFFGLLMIKRVIISKLGEEYYKTHFKEVMDNMSRGTFVGMEALASASLPEYVKLLTVFSEMAQLDASEPHALRENFEYNLSEMGSRAVLVLAVGPAYRKYRTYMKNTGTAPLYPSEESFQIALREIPQFVQMTNKTHRLEVPSAVLWMEELIQAGVPAWKGKPIKLSL